jgi:hypothetical protein
MNKLQASDDVMRELWAIKDSTAAEFATVGAYFSHLRQLARQRSSALAVSPKKAKAHR